MTYEGIVVGRAERSRQERNRLDRQAPDPEGSGAHLFWGLQASGSSPTICLRRQLTVTTGVRRGLRDRVPGGGTQQVAAMLTRLMQRQI